MEPQEQTQQVEQIETTQVNPDYEVTTGAKHSIGKIVLIILGILVVSGYWAYSTLIKPYIVTGRAIAQLSQYDSAQVTYTSPDEKLKMTVDASGDNKPVKLDVKIAGLRENAEDTLELSGIFLKNDVYAQSKYSDPEFIEKSLVAIYPLITKTQTYKMASSLWQGSEWLHLAIPETEESKDDESETSLSDKETRQLAWDWYWAVKPGKIEKNYPYQGESYTKVSYGFRKDQLIKAINGLKNIDVEIKVSQINSMIEIIESSDDWDRDLVTFLIDKEGDLRVVTIQLPEIEQEVIDKSIAEGVTEQEGGALVGGVVDGVKEMIWGVKGDMVELGVVTFGKFDQVEEISIPDNIIEANLLMAVAQQELGPIFAQMMGVMMQGGKTSPSTMAPTTKQPVATSKAVACTQFKIREGEFASDKCYIKSDYDDLMYYIQRYNSAISTYNGEAAQANVTCNGSSEMFKQSCEESKIAMQKAETDKQSYASTIRAIIARGR